MSQSKAEPAPEAQHNPRNLLAFLLQGASLFAHLGAARSELDSAGADPVGEYLGLLGSPEAMGWMTFR